MDKPAHDAPAIDHIIYGMAQIENERQEACIHCGKVWYASHHRDGVCRSCAEKKLPGRRETALRLASQAQTRVLLLIACAIGAFVIAYSLF